VTPSSTTSGTEPFPHCHHRGSTGHRLDHRQPERLAPSDRKYQACGIAEKFGLLSVSDLADELDMRLCLFERAAVLEMRRDPARKLWLPSLVAMPAVVARRPIIA
jgi:hypothetical protein